MFEPNPVHYNNLKLWLPTMSFLLNDYVLYDNTIYIAKSNVAATTTPPVADTANWDYVTDFLLDEITPENTFRHFRITFNTAQLALKNVQQRLETLQDYQGFFVWRGAWEPNTQYKKGDVVFATLWRNVFVAKTNHVSNSGAFNSTNWEILVDLTGITPIHEIRTSSFTAEAGKRYFLNSLGGAMTVTLPTTPTIATPPIWITHIDGDVAVQTITIARNGANIMGFPEDIQIDKNFASFMLAYSDTAHGWRITIL